MADAARTARPGWVTTVGWGLLAVAAVGLPVTLAVLAVLRVRAAGGAALLVLQGVLVLLAVAGVVAAERGLSWVAREQGLGAAAGAAVAVAGVVLLGVLVDPVGTVLLGVALVVGVPVLLAAVGYLGYWRWQHGPRPTVPARPSRDEVRAEAERRRVAVRARHALTREAVEQGLIGPGFTRGSGRSS